MSDNSTKRLHNGASTEVVYDSEGHLLAAGDTIEVKAPVKDDRTKALLKSGRLVEVEAPHNTPAQTASKSARDAKNGDK